MVPFLVHLFGHFWCLFFHLPRKIKYPAESISAERRVVIHGVARGSVRLPCNTSAISEENYPMLVMWFKDDNLNPFYR